MEKSKGQLIRVIDVIAIGPFMIYAGMKKSNLPPWIKAGLIILGGSTIIYNGRNYIINKGRTQ